jgi:hypothetical protein
MNCPKCKSPTEVINSRKKNGTVVRRRLCACGERFSTKEVIITFQQRIRKPIKALSMSQSVGGHWTLSIDKNTPDWAKKMLINL